MKHKMILDSDPSHDDAIAELLDAQLPEIDLPASTTVPISQTLEKMPPNALKVCSLVFGYHAAPVHDPLAVAVELDPDSLHVRTAQVAIEATGEWTSGRVVCDLYGKPGREPNVCVGSALEVEGFWDMVIETSLSY